MLSHGPKWAPKYDEAWELDSILHLSWEMSRSVMAYTTFIPMTQNEILSHINLLLLSSRRFHWKVCQHRGREGGCETNSNRHRMVTGWNQFVEALTRPGSVWTFKKITFFTNLSDSCWMQQHCVASGCGQITKIIFYSYPGGTLLCHAFAKRP